MPRLTDIYRSSLLLFLTQSRRICLNGCHVKQRFGELTLLAGLAAVYRLAAQNNPQDLASDCTSAVKRRPSGACRMLLFACKGTLIESAIAVVETARYRLIAAVAIEYPAAG